MICDRATIIYKGKVVLDGKIQDITQHKSLEEVFIDLISKEDQEVES